MANKRKPSGDLDCSDFLEGLDELLDGEAELSRAREMSRHAAACATCRREILKRKSARRREPAEMPVPGGDWLGRIEDKMARTRAGEEVWKAMFLPWEKKIPLWSAAVVIAAAALLILIQSGCRPAPEPAPAATPAPVVTPAPAAAASTPAAPSGIRFRAARTGGVLIVEEPEGAPAPPASRRPFQDHFVVIKVVDPEAALPALEGLLGEMGGSAIGYPVKGFENLQPNERLALFDQRDYRSFLQALEKLGKVEYPPLDDSDFITVRLTLLKAE